VLEKEMDGMYVTRIEDEESAKEYARNGKPSKDVILDFSRIQVNRPIDGQAGLHALTLEMSGIDPGLIPDDHRQTVRDRDGRTGEAPFVVHIETEEIPPRNGGKDDRHESVEAFLASTPLIQSTHREIVEQARKIVAPDDSDLQKVRKLLAWTAEEIENKIQDSFSALSVLRSREGECQSHAYLFTAMARAVGIPTRIVTGLTYSEDMGFLHHAWAESYLDGGWVAVDPTLNQIPADPTHVKLLVGDPSEQVGTILRVAGKLKIRVMDFQ
jgi:transglutaminase-like putative cysteine protease